MHRVVAVLFCVIKMASNCVGAFCQFIHLSNCFQTSSSFRTSTGLFVSSSVHVAISFSPLENCTNTALIRTHVHSSREHGFSAVSSILAGQPGPKRASTGELTMLHQHGSAQLGSVYTRLFVPCRTGLARDKTAVSTQ